MTRARDVANIDGLLTTTGDTYYASAAGTPARLGIGSTDQVLKVSGGVPAWGAAPASAVKGCSLTNSAGISLTNATDTKVTWNTENYDTDAFHVASSGDIVIPTGLAGKYLITGTMCFDAGTSGQRYAQTKVNGTLVCSIQDSAPVAAGVPKAVSWSTVQNLAVADSIAFHAYQSNGGALQILFTGGYVTNVQITYLGA